jgi:hypothetical protein
MEQKVPITRADRDKPVEISAGTLARVAAKLGWSLPTLDDFRPVGTLSATATGLASCRTIEFSRALLRMHKDFFLSEPEHERTERIREAMFLYVGIRLCMNDAERVVTDDDGIIAFVDLNEMFIARLCKVAFAANRPGAVTEIVQ